MVRATPWIELAHRHLLTLLPHRTQTDAAEELAVVIAAAALRSVQPARAVHGTPRSERAARQLFNDAQTALIRDAGLGALQVAQMVGCSPHHLSRIFTRYTGRGIAAYRTTLRTNQVLDALADGCGSLADLAAATGFTDHAHLSRTVRHRYGATPSALRTLLQTTTGSADGSGRSD